MQTLLNNIIYLVFTAYGICFLFQIYQGFNQFETPQLDTESPESESDIQEIAVLSTKIKEFGYTVEPVANPSLKSYNNVTIAEMKAYIKEQQIETKVAELMGKKLYKARKKDYYQALNAI